MSGTKRKNKRVIVCAAVKLVSGQVVCGVRHFDKIMLQSMPPNTPEGRALLVNHEQGFVDNYYQFLSREEAWPIALEAGQVDPEAEDYSGLVGLLYSEDLY